ncbi:hypothetical protein F5Y08DRAFT_345600 [Xylaria arbuscula]|nr:hypothetical protein F5Y08DRAFT_345600 [Xylaria arbuscula]
MASATTNPTGVLQVALSEFQSVLSDNDRKRLQKIKDKPEADAAIQFTATLDQENAAKRKGPSISTRLYSFLLSVQQFSNVVDTFVSSNPSIAALVWGTVKLTIQRPRRLFMISINGLLDFANTRAYFLHPPVFKPPSARQAHLVASLTQNFQSELENHIYLIKKAGREVSLEVDLAKAHADVEEQQLQQQERTLASGHRLALTSFISKSDDEASEAQKWREIVSRRNKTEENQRRLDLISTFDHVTAFNQARSKRYHSTGGWVFQTPEWHAWIDESSSRVCWLSGKIGSGKTVLSATITDHLLATRRVCESISFFFPRFDYSESLLADSIIRSLIRQNLQPDIVDKLSNDMSKAHSSFYSQEAVLSLLLAKTSMFSTNYFIIDSLDECEPRERQALIQILSATVKRSSSKVKILIASRDNLENELISSFPQITRLRMNAREAASDLELFTHQTLSERMNVGQLAVGNIVSFEAICDAIVKGAQGMFIWVALEIDDVCSQVCEEDVIVALRSMPPTFTGILSRALDRIISQGHDRIAKETFMWISVAKRPLLLDELQDALSIRVGESYRKPERLPQRIENLSAWCANLIEVDELSKTVQFIHHSVRTFILDTSIVDLQSPKLVKFHHHLHDSEVAVGELCVTYLEWNDFKRALQPSSRKSIQKVKVSEPRRIIETTLPAGWQSQIIGRMVPRSSRRQTQLKITDSREQDRNSYYPFLEYAKKYWLLHTRVLPTESLIYSSWRQMIQSNHPIARTEWTQLEYMSAAEVVLTWATTHCHIAILFELKSAGYLHWGLFYEWSCQIIASSQSLREVWRYLKKIVELLPPYWTSDMVDNIRMDVMRRYLLFQGGNIGSPPPAYTITEYNDQIAFLDIQTNLQMVNGIPDWLEAMYWASVQLCLADLMTTLLVQTRFCEVPDFVYIEPLHVAILAQNVTAVDLLLQRGANPNVSCRRNDWSGNTDDDRRS